MKNPETSLKLEELYIKIDTSKIDDEEIKGLAEKINKLTDELKKDKGEIVLEGLINFLYLSQATGILVGAYNPKDEKLREIYAKIEELNDSPWDAVVRAELKKIVDYNTFIWNINNLPLPIKMEKSNDFLGSLKYVISKIVSGKLTKEDLNSVINSENNNAFVGKDYVKSVKEIINNYLAELNANKKYLEKIN